MTWHNLPCPPTLHAIAAACPHGWIEFNVSHYDGDSGPGGAHPQEPDTFLDNRRMWGIDSDDQQEMLMMWSALPGRSRFEPWRLGKGVPHGATVLARIERAPLRCNLCGGPCDEKTMMCARGWDVDPSAVAHDGCLGAAIVEIDLVTAWGEGGKPVYWLGETPDYTGQPDHRDMIDYLRGTADNLASIIGDGDPKDADDLVLEAVETAEVVAKLREIAARLAAEHAP